MNNTVILLERVRMACDPQSKNQVANAIGADASLVRRWYRQHGYPNGVQCLEISKILRMDLGSVLAYIAEDKAKTKHAREMVAKHLPRLLPTAGLALALAVGELSGGYMDAEAAGQKGLKDTTNLYIMRSRDYLPAQILAQIKRYFRRCLPKRRASTGRPIGRFRFALRYA